MEKEEFETLKKESSHLDLFFYRCSSKCKRIYTAMHFRPARAFGGGINCCNRPSTFIGAVEEIEYADIEHMMSHK